eukprot:TRINITY_DN4121_c0_g1_i1.p1 TRINITY_DN4121_c0_g1~~TRINITY_DN4121_c0_g1_i1.p1  ORF type:complete len:295 (+),score=82.16 TRINITY_DN4121_c0_g1_i1:223-1107(+)
MAARITYDEAMSTLQNMFPNCEFKALSIVLHKFGGHMENTVEYLISHPQITTVASLSVLSSSSHTHTTTATRDSGTTTPHRNYATTPQNYSRLQQNQQQQQRSTPTSPSSSDAKSIVTSSVSSSSLSSSCSPSSDRSYSGSSVSNNSNAFMPAISSPSISSNNNNNSNSSSGTQLTSQQKALNQMLQPLADDFLRPPSYFRNLASQRKMMERDAEYAQQLAIQEQMTRDNYPLRRVLSESRPRFENRVASADEIAMALGGARVVDRARQRQLQMMRAKDNEERDKRKKEDYYEM